MLEILQFIFSGTWIFLGTIVLFFLTIVLTASTGWAIARIILAFRGVVPRMPFDRS